MCIVPCVVVDQSCSIGKTCNLISVVPPGHNDGILLGVHSQPVVSLTIVVDDVSLPFVF